MNLFNMNITPIASKTPVITSVIQCIDKYMTEIMTVIIVKYAKYVNFRLPVKLIEYAINIVIAVCNEGRQLFWVVVE